ncbi:energy transducer TonB [Cellulophaga sp. F20128]|uniref:energy transducer TonB n=1 Tax=Cellulophaga sp. F20128 TaxID=2926413 RepID=UPI001FF5EA17|nr:energy transducer TonB [Cellulophaga sp. F20128]MCK0155562.1 energy transducer TonB [Cellulophaga sp. F20128]
MEPKKNPQADLTKNSGLYFAIGLAVVMFLVWQGLEYKKYDDESMYDFTQQVDDMLDEEVPMTQQLKTPPPPPPPAAPEVIDVVEDEVEIEETIIQDTESNEEDVVVEVDDVVAVEVEVDVDVPFSVIEDVPVFPGCEKEKKKGANALRECFNEQMNKHIRKNFRYPEIAQEMGVQGKVNIRFVIQKDGSIGQVQMRGPDKNLEKEAARIIGLLPKMTPGKQRGRAVRVPFSLPITFRLQ